MPTASSSSVGAAGDGDTGTEPEPSTGGMGNDTEGGGGGGTGNTAGTGGTGPGGSTIPDGAIPAFPGECNPPCEPPESCYSVLAGPDHPVFFCADPENTNDGSGGGAGAGATGGSGGTSAGAGGTETSGGSGNGGSTTTIQMGECDCDAPLICIQEIDAISGDPVNYVCVADPSTCAGARTCACLGDSCEELGGAPKVCLAVAGPLDNIVTCSELTAGGQD